MHAPKTLLFINTIYKLILYEATISTSLISDGPTLIFLYPLSRPSAFAMGN